MNTSPTHSIGTYGKVLLVDRDAANARLLRKALGEALSALPQLVLATTGRQALDCLRQNGFDLMLVDVASLFDIADTVEDAVGRLVRVAQGALIIAISDSGSVSGAVAAMRAGAHDYVARPISGALLARRIGELAERHGKPGPVAVTGNGQNAVADYAGFIGGSSAMQFVYEQIDRIAPSTAPVFITGESGTGKDVCAEALHVRGPRAQKPFIAINCAAIPRDLMESELFGAVRGAYTGAHEDRRGAAELASGGTLFLDEIGEMDLSLQSKLLRFLQTGTISRIGESTSRSVDVRVICATNRNPMQMIAERAFREDLFYRLHVLPIHLPPLRQRPADIMPLAEHFLTRYGQEEHKRFSGFGAEAANAMMQREWPGNVRQLQNATRRLVVMFDGGEITLPMLERADLEFAVQPVGAAPRERRSSILPMWQQEQKIIEDAIALCNGNISLAAAALEISPSTIYRKRQNWADIGQVGAA